MATDVKAPPFGARLRALRGAARMSRASLAAAAGLSVSLVEKLEQGQTADPRLSTLYALADVAFVGGSLVPRGGHNIIEPAQHGVAIVTGNHTENFRDIVGLFQSRDALRVVGLAELPLVLIDLLDNDGERMALARRAKETVLSQMGATARTLGALQRLMAEADPVREASASAAPNR